MRVEIAPVFVDDGTNYVLAVDKAIVPRVTDGAALGTTLLNWSDLFLDSGAVINFDGGDVTLTHAANLLTLGGGDFHLADGFGAVFGHTAQVTVGGDIQEFQVLGTVPADAGILIGRWSANSGGTSLRFVKSRDPVIADGTFAIVADNDPIARFRYFADDGVDLDTEIARHTIEVDDATPAENGVGAAYTLLTATAAGALTENLRVAEDGGVFLPNIATGTGNAINITANELVENTSSKFFKRLIRGLDFDTSRVYDLVPRSFRWRQMGRVGESVRGKEDFGLVAEEVAEIMPELVHYKDDEPYAVRYELLSVLLLNELKKFRKEMSYVAG